MADLRPKRMTQGEFAELLRENGFQACSKAAVSLAERPKESGVQFTPEARETAQRLLNSARRPEKRANPNKTTVWLDDETREWVQTQAYLRDLPVGEFIRGIIREAKEKAASDAATSEAAGMVPNAERAGEPGPYGHLHDTTNEEENQG